MSGPAAAARTPGASPAPSVGLPSTWAPLRIPIFRMLWIAALVSNVGSAMHGVGAAWLITSRSPSAAIVAMLQSASALPSFLLSLPAGALADVIDRRRMLVIAQTLMFAAATALAVATLTHTVIPGATTTRPSAAAGSRGDLERDPGFVPGPAETHEKFGSDDCCWKNHTEALRLRDVLHEAALNP